MAKISITELIEAVKELPLPSEHPFPQITVSLPEQVRLNNIFPHGTIVERKIFFDKNESGDGWELDLA